MYITTMIAKILIYLLLHNELCYGINWLQHLTNYIQKDAKVNQVIILSDNNKTNELSIHDDLFEITSRFPNIIINLQLVADDLFSKLIINDPQEVLFIIIADGKNFTSLKKPFSLVNNLNTNRSRPKILIIFSSQTTLINYDSLLREMWSHDFLDATIVSTYTRQRNLKLAKESQRIRLYYHNPHTNSTWSKKFSLKVKWFPDKTQNLHSYNLTAIVTVYHPEIFVTINQTGHREFSGLGWTKFKTLSELMNFRLVTKYYDNWGYLNCENKYKSSGAYHSLISKESDFTSIEVQRLSSCGDKIFEWSIGITKPDVCLVVPIFKKEFYILSDYWKILNLFGVISLPIVIWMWLRIAHIETEDLKITYLIQIILGSSIPREPHKLPEKTIFIFLIVTCTLYSSMIYTAFTDVGLQRKTIYSLETLDDVLSSDLDTEIHINFINVLRKVSSPSIMNLLHKAIKVHRPYAKCLQQLVKKKNIVCLAPSFHAKFLLGNINDKCHVPKVKILENDYLYRGISQTVLAPRSPYVNRINTVLQRLIQSGITKKWKSPYEKTLGKSDEENFRCFDKSKESQQILRQMFIILLVGYSFSILMFFAEIFVLYRLKFKASHFKIAKLVRGK